MASRLDIRIPVRPWFCDHHFNGKTIFPAVETMLLLAGCAKELAPEIEPRNMFQAQFPKFLEIPPGAEELPVLVEYEQAGDEICVKLLSRTQFKKMSRIKEHGTIHFSSSFQEPEPVRVEKKEKKEKKEMDLTVEANRIYKELVPFGPAYSSIKGELLLSKNASLATVQALETEQQPMEESLGSPFPLDGAMHAACVLGQRIVDYVPFPVAFAHRFVHTPTRAGATYIVHVILTAQEKGELVFDISLYDSKGTACETVIGLRMRDVSGGMVAEGRD